MSDKIDEIIRALDITANGDDLANKAAAALRQQQAEYERLAESMNELATINQELRAQVERLDPLYQVADRAYTHLDNGGKIDSNTAIYDLLRDALNAIDSGNSEDADVTAPPK